MKYFIIKRFNSTVFSFEPVMENCRYSLSQTALNVNIDKFNKLIECDYDYLNGCYYLHGNKVEMKYKYLLNETFAETLFWKKIRGNNDIGNDFEKLYFEAVTDGQYGDYDNFKDSGFDEDDLEYLTGN